MKIEQATYDPLKDRAAEVNPFEKVSRDRCAMAAGVVMARSWAPALIHAVVNAGYDEFERVYRPIAHLHGFKQEDIKAIFALLSRTAALNPAEALNIQRMPTID